MPTQIRSELLEIVLKDLRGPAHGEEEVISEQTVRVRYILDPKEVYGEDFPGETFRVLKEKEVKQFGEYWTRRLVLEAWDALNGL
jgi:hypothetical protein